MNDPKTATTLKRHVRATYAALAAEAAAGCGCGCGCGEADGFRMIGDDYERLDGYVPAADLGLGCGVPTDHAGLQPGQTVLDLGAGAGIDAFVARRIVGEGGRVIGVDMTPEMVARARANAAALGYANVVFVEGEIEALPLPDAHVDVVLSNCVLNLVPDKPRAFAEMVRVLRPGGHFCVSDIVATGDLPEPIRRSAELYAGCVAGAIDRDAYLEALRAAGFVDVEVVQARSIGLPSAVLEQHLAPDEAAAFRASDAGLWSVTVRGTRPA